MLLFIASLSSYSSIKEDPNIPVKELTGYRLKSKTFVYNDYNLWVITNKGAFEKLFVADTGTKLPDFGEEIILAAKVETISSVYRISFRKTIVRRNELDIYFTVQKHGPGQNGAGPVSLVAIPRNTAVKRINFYHDDMLVRRIPIVAVY